MAAQPGLDPGLGESFWEKVRTIPGYPRGETVRLRRMLFESNALHRVPEVLAEVGVPRAADLLVVMDETPMRRAGADLKPLLQATLQRAGWSPATVVAQADASGQVHTDSGQIEAVRSRLTTGSAVLSVGSGTITDIAKHACHLFERDARAAIPFIAYQTANSVSAYTSNMAPVFVDGVKRTLPSRYPDALVCDLETLRDAPYAMTAAGVGDLLAAGVSFADWYLAHSLGLDDAFTPLSESLMGPLGSTLLELAADVRGRDLQSMASLAKLIALAGLAMSLSHATTPLSGHEHVVSHMLDLIAEAEHRPLAMHGAQVALAAARMASIYQLVLTGLNPSKPRRDPCIPDADREREAMNAAFATLDPSGRAAEECWRDYIVKLEGWRARGAHLAAWQNEWPRIRSELATRTWSPQMVREIMRAAGLPERFEELDPPVSEADARQAFLSAHWIRRRSTLGDLLYFAGWDRGALWDSSGHDSA